jgi:cardiolipin synthase
MLVDNKRLIVGSINLAPGSFDSRRELGIEVTDKHIIKRMMKIVRHDWKHSHPMDLTDKGLLAEFKRHHIDDAGELAIRRSSKKGK